MVPEKTNLPESNYIFSAIKGLYKEGNTLTRSLTLRWPLWRDSSARKAVWAVLQVEDAACGRGHSGADCGERKTGSRGGQLRMACLASQAPLELEWAAPARSTRGMLRMDDCVATCKPCLAAKAKSSRSPERPQDARDAAAACSLCKARGLANRNPTSPGR